MTEIRDEIPCLIATETFANCLQEPDCPFKHSYDDIKECNMFRLGFCIYGPLCRYKHTPMKGIFLTACPRISRFPAALFAAPSLQLASNMLRKPAPPP